MGEPQPCRELGEKRPLHTKHALAQTAFQAPGRSRERETRFPQTEGQSCWPLTAGARGRLQREGDSTARVARLLPTRQSCGETGEGQCSLRTSWKVHPAQAARAPCSELQAADSRCVPCGHCRTYGSNGVITALPEGSPGSEPRAAIDKDPGHAVAKGIRLRPICQEPHLDVAKDVGGMDFLPGNTYHPVLVTGPCWESGGVNAGTELPPFSVPLAHGNH